MALITFQNGEVVLRDGKVGTESGCCCGQCAQPCPDYCGCEEPSPSAGLPPIPAFYSGGYPIGAPSYGFYDCAGITNSTANCQGRSACQAWEFEFLCDGTPYQILIEISADLVCSGTDADHPTHPGCGTNCQLQNIDMVVTGDIDAPCYDEANIVFMQCPPCV